MRQESDVEQTIRQYADMVKHICFVYMKNESDTEDVFQDVFLKYALHENQNYNGSSSHRYLFNRRGRQPCIWRRMDLSPGIRGLYGLRILQNSRPRGLRGPLVR